MGSLGLDRVGGLGGSKSGPAQAQEAQLEQPWSVELPRWAAELPHGLGVEKQELEWNCGALDGTGARLSS